MSLPKLNQKSLHKKRESSVAKLGKSDAFDNNKKPPGLDPKALALLKLKPIRSYTERSELQPTSIRLNKNISSGLQTKIKQILRQNSNSRLTKATLNRSRMRTQTDQQPDLVGGLEDESKILVMSANAWVFFQPLPKKYVRGFRAEYSQPLGIFSQLLTLYCTYVIAVQFHLDIHNFQCMVSGKASEVGGLTGLFNKDELVQLYGLVQLLQKTFNPQCEYVIALNLGAYLLKKQKKEFFSVFDMDFQQEDKYIETFILFMNNTANALGLVHTKVVSLFPEQEKTLPAYFPRSRTTAYDIARLASECLELPWYSIKDCFRKPINVALERESKSGKPPAVKSSGDASGLEFVCTVKFVNKEGDVETREVSVQTPKIDNSLGGEQYSSYRYVCRNQNRIGGQAQCVIVHQSARAAVIIVLMKCHSIMEREKDIQKALEWYQKHQKMTQNLMIT